MRGEHPFAGEGDVPERKVESLDGFQFLFLIKFLQRFDSRLHYVRQSGFGPETVDKRLDFFLPAFLVEPGLFINLFILGDLGIVSCGVPGNFTTTGRG